ncbi:LLM class flavin-dependent oxidoreductase [Naumannella huperziae]
MRTWGVARRDHSVDDIVTVARAAESAGASYLLLPETGLSGDEGRDPFLVAAAALTATERLVVATAVAVAPARPARLTAVQAATLAELSGGRFVLGLGTSHHRVLERLGLPIPERPMSELRDYVAAVRDNRPAFGPKATPIWIGALGPKMIEFAVTDTDGVVLNWLTPETAAAPAALARDGGAESALIMRTGPYAKVSGDAAAYLAMPNYARQFARIQITEPEQLVAQTCVSEPDDALIVERLHAYADAGISIPCVYPVGMDADATGGLLARVGRRLA